MVSRRNSEALFQKLTALAVAYTVGSILLATLLSPGFSWRRDAFSHLGVTTTEVGTTGTAILFNGGLIGGGLLGSLMALQLFRQRTGVLERVLTGLLGVTYLFLALVGVFPAGTEPHFPVAGMLFLLITITLWVDSVHETLAGRYRRAAYSFLAGAINIVGWTLWVTSFSDVVGLAVPELVGALVFGGWVWWYARRWEPGGEQV